MEYNKNNPLKVVTLCSGYDSQCLALERLKTVYPEFDYELVAWSEFDPESKTPLERQPAVVAHNALFPQWKDRNLGDMTKINWGGQNLQCDLLFYSTPCQSISQAGLQHGFTEGSGTRSSIIWNVRDAVIALKPKYLCLENVKAMVSKKFVGMFNLWQLELERLVYRNFSKVLNAKDYGVPQNRERIFLVSIRDDGDLPRFFFPQPFPLERRLKDVLEENVDDKYYLSDKMIECFQKHTEVQIQRGNGFRFEPQDGSKVAKKITFHNTDEGEVAKSILAGCYKFGAATLLRQNGSTMTSVIEVIETNMAEQNAIELPSELKGKKFRIRKLTPKECFRLMGVDDKDIDKIQAAGISNSGQYKLAGNSIVVDVLFHLFRKMFIEKGMEATKEGQQLSLF